LALTAKVTDAARREDDAVIAAEVESLERRARGEARIDGEQYDAIATEVELSQRDIDLRAQL
jgi:hypothetical protein